MAILQSVAHGVDVILTIRVTTSWASRQMVVVGHSDGEVADASGLVDGVQHLIGEQPR